MGFSRKKRKDPAVLKTGREDYNERSLMKRSDLKERKNTMGVADKGRGDIGG